MVELATSTFEEVRALTAARVVAILPVGAVEAHGPHLPLATDVVIAEAMARAAAGALAARGLAPLLLPAIAYTTAEFAAAFDGTISIRPATLRALVADIALSLARRGTGVLAIA
ncbi:MAG: creatininase family protein, partial [Polyangiaceae bacterium]